VRGAEPALLDTYESERAPVARGVLGLSTRLGQAVMASGAGHAGPRHRDPGPGRARAVRDPPDGMVGVATDRPQVADVLAWLRDAGPLAGR